jgi:ribonuclease P/MRP protein subunit POP1
MIEDRTVSQGRKKLSSHQRMRLETVKKLQTAKKKAQEAKAKAKDAEAGAENTTTAEVKRPERTTIKVKKPRIKNNTLRDPPVPRPKFKKRQINKTWLPTHMFHTKRAHMTPAKETLWRFAIPLTPTEKCYRQTHRASALRGAIAWDTSYMSTICLRGLEKSLEGLLKGLGVGSALADKNIWFNRKTSWRKGTRSWHGMLYKRQEFPNGAICPATIIWNPEDLHNVPILEEYKDPKRSVILRAHPSAFLELWEEILRLSKVQKPSVTVEDLRYEIGSIEVVGPSSTEALVGTLHPIESSQDGSSTIQTAEKVWKSLKILQNPSLLPRDAILSFEASDPRLHQRIKVEQPLDHEHDKLLQALAKWPLDKTSKPISLFDREKRQKASQLLASQKSISRRKAILAHGDSLQLLETDPRIPILLFTQQLGRGHQGSWTLLLPWKIVSTVWYALVHYPLSSGDTPRFGGLNQHRQVMYEAGFPWFPADYPGTAAGMQWEQQGRVKAKAEWEKRPKGRRPEFDSLDLGNGRKGEIGMSWACDWERLVKGPGVSGEN